MDTFLEVAEAATSARVSFLIKLQVLGLQLYLKKDFGTCVLLRIFFFFEKIFVFFYKIYIICKKKCFYGKKTFFTDKNINENVKNTYLISKIYFYTENICYK